MKNKKNDLNHSENKETNNTKLFLQLLFDDGDIIQVKPSIYTPVTEAKYLKRDELLDETFVSCQAFSHQGYFFCQNAIPQDFHAKLYEFWKWADLGERNAFCLAEGLSLKVDNFNSGRCLFIEADQTPDGEEIRTESDRLNVQKSILETGLPVSYILDTGGRGKHIGIVLQDSITLMEFGDTVTDIFKRLPKWIDRSVGKINQMERLPGTQRLNKLGEVVDVKLDFVGSRIKNTALMEWIEKSPIITENVGGNKKLRFTENVPFYDISTAERLAWEYISKNLLNSSRVVRNEKIQVSCPSASNHKSGNDKNMSAFINVKTGLVWCSACNKKVGSAFINSSSKSVFDSFSATSGSIVW